MDDWLTELPDGVKATCFSFRFPFVRPVAVAPGGRTIESTEGVLVRLQDEDGHEGWGEATTLPGFVEASIDEICASARAWVERDTDRGPASLAFAIDSALTDLMGKRAGQSWGEVLGAERSVVELNALIDDVQAARATVNLTHRMPGTVKMKVGRMPVDEDIERVLHVRRSLPRFTKLRLDANRTWDLDTARRFLEAVSQVDIEYIEEPLTDASQLPQLAEEFEVGLALDETLREMDVSDLEGTGWCAAIVLKPSIHGSLERYRSFVSAATRNGKAVVLSSAYESGVGMQMIVALAAALPIETAHGFSPYQMLESDVLEPRLDLNSWRVRTEQVLAPRRIRLDMLTEVR